MKGNATVTLSVIVLVVAAGLTGFASAKNENEKISIVTEHLPPFQVVQDNRVVTGMAHQVVQAMLGKLDYSFEVRVYPWARAYQRALTEKNTLIYSIARTQGRENLFRWVGEVYRQQDYLWCLNANNNIRIESLDDAKRYLIAVPRNDNQYQFLTKNGFTSPNNLYLVTDWEQAIGMLRSERVDMIMGTTLSLAYFAEDAGLKLEDFKPCLRIDSQRDAMFIAFSQQTPDRVFNDFKQAYQTLVENGTLHSIQKRWENPPPKQ
ncbi:substrate-binding periplasmic protein [Alteromonas aestuariivivens]|uniref:substrate-binding periplasmic protein n=1 Tax=Alteromonas aestuariivivens TaxID=1938339 RepID=UPI0015F28073|nr:ABC transporter substrate-binding protein [Alteromonas aestuariivivens]